MRKLIVLTDLHLLDPGETIIGLDPGKRLTEALDHALAHHADAMAVVLVGDLTHHGTPSQYRALEQVMTRCPLPVWATVGNHDTRENYFDAFPDAHSHNGFAMSAQDFGAHKVLILDTVDETGTVPRHAGHLCQARLDWIDQQLHRASGRSIAVFCHHPPFRTGFDGMDAIRLLNGDALLSRLAAHDAPVHLVCGHVHRTISGHVHGIGYTVLKSPCHQMPLRLGDPSSGSSVDEPGAYGVVLDGPDGLIVHTEDFALAARAIGKDASSE